MTSVRAPAVAGHFYPDDPQTLTATVDRLLAEAAEAGPDPRPAPKALIVPHAGYIYSGSVAAKGYRLLKPLRGRVRRVVLIGPAHHHWTSGVAAPEVEAFETPIGALPVDRAAVTMIAALPQVVLDDAPHEAEHSLEVQLPFIQRVLGEVAIVPLVVGGASPKDVAEVLARLWGGPETLILISSDLSHGRSYLAAQRLDRATAQEIEALQLGALGPEHACGCRPINGLMVEARDRGLQVQRLDLCNSGDTAGPRDRVVGYGAWAFRAAA